MNAHTPLKFLHRPDCGLLFIRVMFGVVGVYHGSQKLFGIWDGHGMKGFTGFLETMHVPMPTLSAWMAALAEFAGGILIALGLVPRIAAFFFAFTMLVAWGTAHHFSFDQSIDPITQKSAGGNDYPFALALVAIGLIFTGPGKYSLMALINKHKSA